jgi:hypothetical protein
MRVDLPGALLISVEQRVARAEFNENKLVAHVAVWRAHVQVAVFFPTTRVEADTLLGRVLDQFDPELRQNLEKATAWLDALPEGASAPPNTQGALN